MQKMLLHTCCAPCAIYVVQELSKQYDLTLFFYNPNIHPDTEYEKRFNEIVRWAKQENINIIESDYNVKDWFDKTKGLEKAPEGGERCKICYRMRLEQTAKYAQVNEFDVFTTTMSISPHKKASVINDIGQKLSQQHDVDFLTADWKKNDGFKIACQLSAEQGFYRQDYCGCIYSKQARQQADEN